MRLLYLLYCLSGFISLGYQVAWFRIFVDRFGSTNLTFAVVLACFIGGLGAGSLASRALSDGIARLTRLKNPLRVYGVVELLIAATALVTLLVPLIPADAWGAFPYQLDGGIHRPVASYRYSHLAISTLCVFPPCFLMGVTFPLLCSAFRHDARFPSALYAWNTLGAGAGILACEFVLLPQIGHSRLFPAMLAANLALGAYFLVTRIDPARVTPARPAPLAPAPAAVAVFPAAVVLAGAVVSGLLTGALEADVLRRLQFLDCRTGAAMSSISFWAVLAIFLASATVRALPRLAMPHVTAGYGAALLACLALWHFAYPLRDWANAADNQRVIAALPWVAPGLSVNFQFFHFGYGLWAVLLFTGLFVFPAFYLLSLLLPLLCNAAQARGSHLGLVYGANTLAFCAGLMAFTVAAPLVNVFYALRLFLGLFAVGVGFLLTLGAGRRLTWWKPSLAALALLVVGVVTPSAFDAGYFPADSQAARFPVRAMKSNGTHTTFVVADPTGDLLFFDSHTMSGCNPEAQQYMRLMAHFPLLAHEKPAAALLICFGVGSTASAIASHDTIEHLDIVDLNDQVLATAPEFAGVNRNVAQDPRVRLIHDDGRRFLDLTDRRYDLITSEPPPPMVAGIQRLYSIEYYRAARARLLPGGMMTQWLPTDQMPLPAMRAAVATFVQVFPHALLFCGSSTNYILLGSTAPLCLRTVERRFAASRRVVEDLHPYGIRDPLHLFARVVKCGPTLTREFGSAAVISDESNYLSRVFHDPLAPSVITYDPVAMLEQIDPVESQRLSCRERLRAVAMHLGRLKSMVADFPTAALTSVRAARGDTVALAGADWNSIASLLDAAGQAVQRQSPAQAIDVLQRVLAIAPEYPAAARWLGLLLMQAQLYEPALATWQRVQALEPLDAEARYASGWTLSRMGRHDAAVTLLRQAIDLDPANLAYCRTLGEALGSAGRWEQALQAYDRALVIDPDDKPARQGREQCLQQLRR